MPAAAVIPATLAYMEAAAAKQLVSGFLLRTTGRPSGWVSGSPWASSWGAYLHFIGRHGAQDFDFGEIRVLQAGIRLEYISME